MCPRQRVRRCWRTEFFEVVKHHGTSQLGAIAKDVVEDEYRGSTRACVKKLKYGPHSWVWIETLSVVVINILLPVVVGMAPVDIWSIGDALGLIGRRFYSRLQLERLLTYRNTRL